MSKVDLDTNEFEISISSETGINSIFDRDYVIGEADRQYIKSLFTVLHRYINSIEASEATNAEKLHGYTELVIEAIYEAPNYKTVKAILDTFKFDNLRKSTVEHLIQHAMFVGQHMSDHLRSLVTENPEYLEEIYHEITYIKEAMEQYSALLETHKQRLDEGLTEPSITSI